MCVLLNLARIYSSNLSSVFSCIVPIIPDYFTKESYLFSNRNVPNPVTGTKAE